MTGAGVKSGVAISDPRPAVGKSFNAKAPKPVTHNWED